MQQRLQRKAVAPRTARMHQQPRPVDESQPVRVGRAHVRVARVAADEGRPLGGRTVRGHERGRLLRDSCATVNALKRLTASTVPGSRSQFRKNSQNK